MKKKALITGGLGFLGRSIARKLEKEDFEVHGIGYGFLKEIDLSLLGYKSWTEGNITFENLIKINEAFDLVVHCASSSSVSHSIQEPHKDLKNSYLTTKELIKFLILNDQEVHLIYPSSAAVYGENKGRIIKENSKKNPISPYGKNKLITEEFLEQVNLNNQNINISIVRFFSLYGPLLKKQLFWDAYHKLKNDPKEVSFSGTGKETRDWLFIEDAVNLIFEIIQNKKKFQIINGAYGKSYSVKRGLSILKKILKINTKILFDGQIREGDPMFYNADITKSSIIGFRPETSLEEGIEKYVKWIKKQ